ncbi:endonuclease III [Clostridium sp. MT-14]|uniref:Endonuclease III n=1 Tax=Clostridium aromativorans TaxID=2836848 RepID=A0ABS8NBY2_9CLOT|nr:MULTISPECIES: endonuclease III [Clostridium]KAA8666945.1 endonuclease III [Clostridium sp. HV4-5-A1G]MCC9296699.1 endonuclease III [Clostridium aromativorans]CAB1261924.1 Endonuclease III [Clostridiaceae bacterium BL-3]
MNKRIVNTILKILSETYPEAKCALKFGSPYELLVATMLSAQCTDVRVNKVTSELYKEFNTPEKMVSLTEEELGEKIKSCGFFRNKSKHILEASRTIMEKYQGQVPDTMEKLITLPGVGRKTADVVLSNAFGVPAIAVDTHVFRVSNRLGIARGNTPHKVEMELMKNIPKDMWSDSHHYLIWHGRQICKSRKPDCEHCPVAPYCEYFNHPEDYEKDKIKKK